MKQNIKLSDKGIKYEVIKVILIKKLIELNEKDKFWIEFYSEIELDENLICPLYFFNLKTKKEIIFEISDKKTTSDKYKEYTSKGTEFVNLIISDFSDDIKEIEKEIEDIL